MIPSVIACSLATADRLIALMETDAARPVPPAAIQELQDAIVGTPWVTPEDREAAQVLVMRLEVLKPPAGRNPCS